ncbi:hypothetical protein PIB30_055955 [Stylosanthes scabra]|uniref:Uncharacterized protein n=1 Tax=Stylosanthes scabra TaxID=79078 RepID=A0ABU6RJ46_9FABA|nr:hypothetical protein [Stylosanthes scabra]
MKGKPRNDELDRNREPFLTRYTRVIERKHNRVRFLLLDSVIYSHHSLGVVSSTFDLIGHEDMPTFKCGQKDIDATLKIDEKGDDPSPVFGIFKLGCTSVTHSKSKSDCGPDKAVVMNQVLSCLNHSLEKILASAEIKTQFLEATSFLNQHVSSEVSSLENLMEELFNSHTLLESSLENLCSATAELSKHKKEVAKCKDALSKVKPLVEMGTAKEQETESTKQTQSVRVEQLEKELAVAKQLLADTQIGLAKIKATNNNLKHKMAKFEQKKSSSNSKCVLALKAMEEAEAKHKQAVETSTRLANVKRSLNLPFDLFLINELCNFGNFMYSFEHFIDIFI